MAAAFEPTGVESLIEKQSGELVWPPPELSTIARAAVWEKVSRECTIPNETAFGRKLALKAGVSASARPVLVLSAPCPIAHADTAVVAAAVADSKVAALQTGSVYACNFVCGLGESFVRVSHAPTPRRSTEYETETETFNSTEVPSGHPLLSRDIRYAEAAGELRFKVLGPDNAHADAYEVEIVSVNRQSSYYCYPDVNTLSALRTRFGIANALSLYRTNVWEQKGLTAKRERQTRRDVWNVKFFVLLQLLSHTQRTASLVCAHSGSLTSEQPSPFVRAVRAAASQFPMRRALIEFDGSDVKRVAFECNFEAFVAATETISRLIVSAAAAPTVGERVRIAVCMSRSAVSVLTLWAIHAAGAIFVPLPCDASALLYSAGILSRLSVQLVLANDETVATRIAALIAGTAPIPVRTLRATSDAQARVSVSLSAAAATAAASEKAPPPTATAAAGNDSKRAKVHPLFALKCDAMYVLHTSGSTATPKSVVGTCGGLWNRCEWMCTRYGVGAGIDIAAVTTKLTFVDSLWQVFGPLSVGVTAVVFPHSAVADSDRFARAIAHYRITLLGCVVPSLLQTLCAGPWNDSPPAAPSSAAAAAAATVQLERPLPAALRLLLVSGEPFHRAVAASVLRVVRRSKSTPECVVVNLYGSTEVSADCTYCEWSGADTASDTESGLVPIGIPIPGNALYYLRSCPDGKVIYLEPITAAGSDSKVASPAAGELAIGGCGVALGYFSAHAPDSKASAEPTAKFVTLPVGCEPNARREYVYCTGDRIQCPLPLRFVSRSDRQLKVSGGYRVDPTSVEDAILSMREIGGAVVLATTTTPRSAPVLVAVVALPSLAAPSLESACCRESTVLEHLRSVLPPYAVPQRVIFTDRFPLTAHTDKVDRAAVRKLFDLPAPDAHAAPPTIPVAIDVPLTAAPAATATSATAASASASGVRPKRKAGAVDTADPIDTSNKLRMETVSSVVRNCFAQTLSAAGDDFVSAGGDSIAAELCATRISQQLAITGFAVSGFTGQRILQLRSVHAISCELVSDTSVATPSSNAVAASSRAPSAVLAAQPPVVAAGYSVAFGSLAQPIFASSADSLPPCPRCAAGETPVPTAIPAATASSRVNWSYNLHACIDAAPFVVCRSETGTGSGTAARCVFVGSHSGEFVCIEMDSALVRWKATLPDRIEASASVTRCGRIILVGCYDGVLYGLCLECGAVRARFQTETSAVAHSDTKNGSRSSSDVEFAPVKASAFVDPANGLIWIGAYDRNLYTLRLSAAEPPANATSIAPVKRHRRTIAKEDVARAAQRKAIESASPSAGAADLHFQVVFSYRLPAAVYARVAQHADSKVIVCAALDGSVVAFATAGPTVRPLWSRSAGAPVFASPLAIRLHSTPPPLSDGKSDSKDQSVVATANARSFDDLVIACSVDGSVHAFELASGLYRWRVTPPPPDSSTAVALFASPVLIPSMPEPVVVVASHSGRVFGIRASNGQQLWMIESQSGGSGGGGIHATPFVYASTSTGEQKHAVLFVSKAGCVASQAISRSGDVCRSDSLSFQQLPSQLQSQSSLSAATTAVASDLVFASPLVLPPAAGASAADFTLLLPARDDHLHSIALPQTPNISH